MSVLLVVPLYITVPCGLLAFWFLLGIYTLAPMQSVLLLKFGKPISATDEAGIHWRPFGIISINRIRHEVQEFPFHETVFTRQELTVTPTSSAADGSAESHNDKKLAMAAVTVEGVVQFSVQKGKDNLLKARYVLKDPMAMIKQRFQNALRATMNVMSMWDALSDKGQTAATVQSDLTHVAEEFGHTIVNISFTNVIPDKSIVDSNNELIASVAEMQTRANKGEGEKQESVRVAEGKALAMIENGKGIAGERDQIIEGWEGAVKKFRTVWPEATAADIMAMVLFQNYLDAQVKLAASGQNKVIFASNNVTGAKDLLSELRQTLVSSSEAATNVAPPAAGK